MKTDIFEKELYVFADISFEKAKDKAFKLFEYIQTTGEDLYDYWSSISDNWDLNIWTDDTDSGLRMSLYKVKNGNTTDEFISIYPIKEKD